MLETKNLVKIYNLKDGIPVRALDGVSLKFPDTGMVFLLGKSGSGKSTLLNVLGGLDKYDEGDIIIKDVSSKDFSQKHFDSYRNTYVGFIFQEYNVLEEFTVGANIALALELQGKKATDEELNRILTEVDLAGFGSRRPNELSGGQKQRVAIARALVKNPKIIMADEPTGALDSATGRQVLDTLKKLSKEKLVIVVSHDREFATNYADRIIELADGRVISDTTVVQGNQEETQAITFDGDTATVPAGYHLTDEDRVAINNYIDSLESGIKLSFKKASAKSFVATDNSKIVTEDKTPFKLIKSKLSLKHAFKIGGSGLKFKKFRLVMTVLLSCVAFTLFGLVDTFSAYNHIQATTNSIYDSSISYAAVSKNIKIDDYWDGFGNKLTDDEIKALEAESGIDFKGVINNNTSGYWFAEHYYESIDVQGGYVLTPDSFGGLVEYTQADLDRIGHTLLAGRLADGTKNEIAISKFVCDAFIKHGYRALDAHDKKVDIKAASDMVGKIINVNGIEYTVTGVVDTGFDASRYARLGDDTPSDAADEILDYVLYREFRATMENDFTGMMLTGEGYVSKYVTDNGNLTSIDQGSLGIASDYFYLLPSYVTVFDNIKDKNIVWLDGEKTKLSEKEIILPSFAIAHTGLGKYDKNGVYIPDYEQIKELEITLCIYKYNTVKEQTVDGCRVVGIIETEQDSVSPIGDSVVVCNTLFDECFAAESGSYDLALGAMPKSKDGIKTLAQYCYTEREGVKYSINNAACYELDSLSDAIDEIASIFLYVGIGFAVFAAILLSNFIATSISYKKQEIGILRAIGSRGNDVFRIFFSEAFIIAMINFILAAVGTGAVTYFINSVMRQETGILITILDFGIRQIAVLFVISVAVAAIASFLPVKRVASKRPIDAIRNK